MIEPGVQLECEQCGKALDGEELEFPRKEEDGTVLCDECWHEEYEFTCCLCEEYGLVEHQHAFVVVFDAEGAGAGIEKLGIYRVIRTPYWCSNYFNAWLFPDAVKWVAPLPPVVEDYYPCGHLCLSCQEELGLVDRPPAC